MKRLLIALVGVGIAVGALFVLTNVGSIVEVQNHIERIEVEKKVTVDALEVRIKEAQEEASQNIETKLEAYRQELLTEVADQVKREYIKEVEASISSEGY